jgi:hypothetical protein
MANAFAVLEAMRVFLALDNSRLVCGAAKGDMRERSSQ